MKVFVWHRVENCSENYHAEGGVVVFAKNERRARELANLQPGCSITAEEKPDDIRDVINNSEEKVYIMPNAGCC